MQVTPTTPPTGCGIPSVPNRNQIKTLYSVDRVGNYLGRLSEFQRISTQPSTPQTTVSAATTAGDRLTVQLSTFYPGLGDNIRLPPASPDCCKYDVFSVYMNMRVRVRRTGHMLSLLYDKLLVVCSIQAAIASPRRRPRPSSPSQRTPSSAINI